MPGVFNFQTAPSRQLLFPLRATFKLFQTHLAVQTGPPSLLTLKFSVGQNVFSEELRLIFVFGVA